MGTTPDTGAGLSDHHDETALRTGHRCACLLAAASYRVNWSHHARMMLACNLSCMSIPTASRALGAPCFARLVLNEKGHCEFTRVTSEQDNAALSYNLRERP